MKQLLKKYLFLVVYYVAFNHTLYGQKNDTLIISAKDVNTKVLIPGTHRWLVYFKKGKDSVRINYMWWNRTIEKINYNGKEAIAITQLWEANDTIMHTAYSVCDAKTFQPLFHDTWTKQGGFIKADFEKKTIAINNRQLLETDTASKTKRTLASFNKSLAGFFLNWHLDLEVFPTMPYRDGRTFAINFYDPGFQAPKLVYYTVAGSGILTGYDNQKIDCWLLTHSQDKTSSETFWISKKTREVLKLEQTSNGRFRYKIKLGFSENTN